MSVRANTDSPTAVPIIGLTGTIGSGKSTVAELFREWGAVILDADVLAREVVVPGSPALAEIGREFGSAAVLPDGTMNRSAVGKLIFSDIEKRRRLEAIVHPRIRAEFERRLPGLRAEAAARNVPLVYVVPLLFESANRYPEIFRTICVYSNSEAAAARVMRRDGLSREEAAARIAAQLPAKEKAARADYVITNEGSADELRAAAREVYDRMLADAGAARDGR